MHERAREPADRNPSLLVEANSRLPAIRTSGARNGTLLTEDGVMLTGDPCTSRSVKRNEERNLNNEMR